MAVHHGGAVGKTAKTLAKKDPSKEAKSEAGKMLQAHQEAKHVNVNEKVNHMTMNF